MWTGIHAVGAAAERRVWTDFGTLRLYPNLFVFLVGPPGTGKTVALNPMANILRLSKAVTLAPNDITKQGLLDKLHEAERIGHYNGRPFDFHFMAIHISELSNFMSQYDSALAGLLTDLFDCPDVNEENKRGHDKGMAINFPGISMIVGTATQNLGHTISDEMWGSGFMARVIVVFSADDVRPWDRFAIAQEATELKTSIVESLSRVGQLCGPMTWTPAAQNFLNTFARNQEEDAPLHNRLTHYVKRRWMHFAKLCMIAALQEERMTITDADCDTALEWLVAAESQMTEVFKDMVSHEDGHLHEQFHRDMFTLYVKTRTPMSSTLLFEWCKGKMASHIVERFIAIAVASGSFKLVREAGAAEDDVRYVPTSPRGWKDRGVL